MPEAVSKGDQELQDYHFFSLYQMAYFGLFEVVMLVGIRAKVNGAALIKVSDVEWGNTGGGRGGGGRMV